MSKIPLYMNQNKYQIFTSFFSIYFHNFQLNKFFFIKTKEENIVKVLVALITNIPSINTFISEFCTSIPQKTKLFQFLLIYQS